MFLRWLFFFIISCCISPVVSYAGTPIPLTVNLSENVIVTGTPRLQLDVGGVTRYAPYVSGTGTNVLLFSYPVVAPDFDRDGITLLSPVDLNGGTIRNVNGNNANLTFIPPNTSAVLVQSYTVTWTTNPVTPANAGSAAFSINNAPTGSTFNYTITSSGGGTPVTGMGIISGTPHNVTGVNLLTLLSGTLTLSITITNATGTGNAKTNTVVATISSGALDSLPATAAAYSVRRLRTAYTGSLIRVRRSSDNAEQDIGYLGNGDLDTTALTTFCGANSCFVRSWYDQSGNTRNAIQAASTNQPRIVNAGVIEVQGSKPSQAFDGTNDRLDISFSFTTRSILTVFKYNTATFSDYNGLLGGPLGDPINGHIINSALPGTTFITRATNANFFQSWRNGTPVVSDNFNPINTLIAGSFIGSADINNSTVWIGNISGGGRFWNGYISEIIIFPSALTNADRQTLENNEKAYYNIP